VELLMLYDFLREILKREQAEIKQNTRTMRGKHTGYSRWTGEWLVVRFLTHIQGKKPKDPISPKNSTVPGHILQNSIGIGNITHVKYLVIIQILRGLVIFIHPVNVIPYRFSGQITR
jgi:hypothetical protein